MQKTVTATDPGDQPWSSRTAGHARACARGARCAAAGILSADSTHCAALHGTQITASAARAPPAPTHARAATAGRAGARVPVRRAPCGRRRGTGVYALPSRLTTFRESWAVAWDMANAVADPSTHLITPTCTASSSPGIVTGHQASARDQGRAVSAPSGRSSDGLATRGATRAMRSTRRAESSTAAGARLSC